ncbi:MAG: hypothetical protein AMXMBFR7_47870 [Planctomycetota bacterium]
MGLKRLQEQNLMITVEVYDCGRRAQTVEAIKFISKMQGIDKFDALKLVNQVYYYSQPIQFGFRLENEACDFMSHLESLGFSSRRLRSG